METNRVPRYHRALPLLTNHINHHQNPNNAPTRLRLRLQTRPFSAMKLTSRPDHLHQTIKRVCAYANNKNASSFRYSRLPSSFDNATTIVKRMATNTDRAAVKDSSNIKKEEEGELKKSQPPPPPEMPEPGDCCGSGCVRCVWDVYYDELEEYNKLYNNCDPNKSKSV